MFTNVTKYLLACNFQETESIYYRDVVVCAKINERQIRSEKETRRAGIRACIGAAARRRRSGFLTVSPPTRTRTWRTFRGNRLGRERSRPR